MIGTGLEMRRGLFVAQVFDLTVTPWVKATAGGWIDQAGRFTGRHLAESGRILGIWVRTGRQQRRWDPTALLLIPLMINGSAISLCANASRYGENDPHHHRHQLQ